VLRSSLSILLTVLVTVCGGGLFRLMGQDVSCWAIADGHRVRKLCPLCVADFVDFKEKKDPAEQAGKPTRDAKSRYWDTILPMRNKKTIIRCA